MKCTNNKRSVFKKRHKKRQIRLIIKTCFICIFVAVIVGGLYLLLHNENVIAAYEEAVYSETIYEDSLVIDDLCVTSKDVSHEDFYIQGDIHSICLFDLSGKEVLCAKKAHERLYPASTTKLLTAYVALKYGKLEDVITVSSNATGVPLDSSRAGLFTGDQVTLETLLYGLMLPSGNDSGVAIAEYISGTEEEFAKLMNEEARKLGATNSHFINAHGYHDENHYTTAYDLYLIMNACIHQEKLMEIVSSNSYSTRITQKNGTYREVTWRQTNRYVNGAREVPHGITVIGGKTGTTDQAGSCLVLYEKSSEGKPYISIVMGADNVNKLYDNMTGLMSLIPN